MEPSNDEAVRRAAQAIEEMGYGWAQIRVLVLCAGVAYIAEMFDADLTEIAAGQFGIDPSSLWATAIRCVMLHHIELGILVGFFIGDVKGRRWLIVHGLGTVAVASWLCVAVQSYYVVTAANVVASVALRSLFVVGIVMASECAPRDSRILHRVLSVGFLHLLNIILGVLDLLHHNPLECSASGSQWCLLPAAIFGSVFWGLCSSLLPESPVFLAGAGQYKRAQEELDTMRKLNGAAEGTGEFVVSANRIPGRLWLLHERLFALVSGQRGAVLLVMVFMLMAVKKGMFAVMEVGPPAYFSQAYLGDWYRMSTNILEMFGEMLAFLNASYFSRNVALGNSLLVLAMFAFLFVVFNPLRADGGAGLMVESIAQFAGAGLAYGCRAVLTVGYQVSIEFWPTMSAVTAGSFIIGMGYSTWWKYAWSWVKGFWPSEMSAMLDVMQLVSLVPLAYALREMQAPADAVSRGVRLPRKEAPELYGTFKQQAEA